MLSRLLTVTVLKVAGTVLWLVYSVVLARLLTAADYGFVMYAITVVMATGPLACVGLNSAMLRFGAVYWREARAAAFRALLAEARRALALASLPMAAVTVAVLVLVDRDGGAGAAPLALAAASVPLYGLMVLHRETLRAVDRTTDAFLGFTIVRAAVPCVLSVALAALGWLTPASALGCMAAGLAVIAAMDVRRIAAAVPPSMAAATDADGRREWYGVARPMVVTEALSHWLARGDVLIVGMMLGTTAAAIYLTAQRLAMLVNFVLDAARMAIEPAIARSHAGADHAAMQALLAEGSLLSLLAGAPAAIVLVAAGGPLLGLYGLAFVDGWAVLAILTAGQFTTALAGPVSAVLRMAGMHRPLTAWSAAISVAQAAAVSAGAALGGIEGAAVGAAAAAAANNVAYLVLVRRRLGLRSGVGSGLLAPGILPRALRDLRGAGRREGRA